MRKIFQEKLSGATRDRPALERCLKKLDPGDTLIVWKFDRLGRSLSDLIRMLDDLKRWRAIRSLMENIDTDTPTGRALWRIIGVMAELGRSQIKKRTKAGIAAAEDRGVKFGRRPALDQEQIEHAKELHHRKNKPRLPAA